MSTPLEDTVEKYFVELLKTNSILAALSIKPFDSDDSADSDGIVVEATQKARRLDGPKGFDVDVRVKLRTTVGVADDRNSVSDLIVRTIYSAAPGATTTEDDFTYLLILDEMTGERTNEKDLRTRERVIPIIARIDD